MIVADASAFASALAADDDLGKRARARLSVDVDQHAPAILDLEVASALRRMLRDGVIDAARADRALADLVVHPLERYPHVALLSRVWELRHNLTPYDASYVALAEALGAVLVTADGRLARAAGPQCSIELLA